MMGSAKKSPSRRSYDRRFEVQAACGASDRIARASQDSVIGVKPDRFCQKIACQRVMNRCKLLTAHCLDSHIFMRKRRFLAVCTFPLAFMLLAIAGCCQLSDPRDSKDNQSRDGNRGRPKNGGPHGVNGVRYKNGGPHGVNNNRYSNPKVIIVPADYRPKVLKTTAQPGLIINLNLSTLPKGKFGNHEYIIPEISPDIPRFDAGEQPIIAFKLPLQLPSEVKIDLNSLTVFVRGKVVSDNCKGFIVVSIPSEFAYAKPGQPAEELTFEP